MVFTLKKMDDELQIVYGEVYAPNIPDTQGDFMTIDSVRSLAHNFMKSQKIDQIDTNHDNVTNSSMVIESFIARKDDPDFIVDAWVVGVHIPNDTLWEKVKSGELNGFSLEAMFKSTPAEITLLIPEYHIGITSKSDEHTHDFIAYYNDDGVFTCGETEVVDGHFHTMSRHTVTNAAKGHTHRFSITEGLIYEA